MLDPLIAIPGHLFLLLFWVLSIAVILIVRYLLEGGSLPLDRLPDPAQLKPQTLAALRGGANAVIRTATFKLWRAGALILMETGRTSVLQTSADAQKPQDRVEALILDACKQSCRPGDLFLKFTPTVEGILEPEYRELAQRGLMKGGDPQAAAWRGTLSGLVIIALVGGSKLWLGLQRDKPVGFLILSLVLVLCMSLVILKPWRPHPLTATGRRFLKDAQERLSWMVSPATPSKDDGSQEVMAMALFGMGALALDPVNESFRRSFSRSSGGVGSGCSGGCGSSSGGGGSSSDGGGDGGGGDGGGGGCGGCGGD